MARCFLDEVVWQQEVRNTFANDVFVLTVGTYELSFADLCLEEKVVEVLDELFVLLEVLWSWRSFWKGWEAELRNC